MQNCGTNHPDNYKRSLGARDQNDTTIDVLEDFQRCLSAFSHVMQGAGNISTASWVLKTIQDVAVKNAGYLLLNVTAEIDGWEKKFEKWDTNGDGVLTWDEALVVRSWP